MPNVPPWAAQAPRDVYTLIVKAQAVVMGQECHCPLDSLLPTSAAYCFGHLSQNLILNRLQITADGAQWISEAGLLQHRRNRLRSSQNRLSQSRRAANSIEQGKSAIDIPPW